MALRLDHPSTLGIGGIVCAYHSSLEDPPPVQEFQEVCNSTSANLCSIDKGLLRLFGEAHFLLCFDLMVQLQSCERPVRAGAIQGERFTKLRVSQL